MLALSVVFIFAVMWWGKKFWKTIKDEVEMEDQKRMIDKSIE